LIPPRFVHETTKLAGYKYNIPAGTQVTDTTEMNFCLPAMDF
jgi:hypothetical protein